MIEKLNQLAESKNCKTVLLLLIGVLTGIVIGSIFLGGNINILSNNGCDNNDNGSNNSTEISKK